MDFWEAVVLIVAIVVIGKVMSGGRWNSRTKRWERLSPDNPYVRSGQLSGSSDDSALLRKDIARLNERVATLEKLATDPGHQLTAEIEQLRSWRETSDRSRP